MCVKSTNSTNIYLYICSAMDKLDILLSEVRDLKNIIQANELIKAKNLETYINCVKAKQLLRISDSRTFYSRIAPHLKKTKNKTSGRGQEFCLDEILAIREQRMKYTKVSNA